MIRSFRKKAGALLGIIHQPVTRRLLEDYVEWAIARQSTNKALGRLPRIADLIERIEQQLPEVGSDLTAAIRESLTTEDIRRAGLFAMFLAERGLMPVASNKRAESSDTRRIEAALEETRGKPWERAIREYATELAVPDRKLAERSRRLYLRSAVQLMAFADIKGIHDLTDEHIRKFLRSKPGHRASIFPWLSFVFEKTNHKLSVPKRVTQKSPTISSVAAEVGQLFTAVRNAPTMKARHALLAKLLSVLYGAPLEHVVAMKRADIDITAGVTRIRFGDDWVTVEGQIAELLSGLVSKSASAKLFPGRLDTDGLSVSAVRYHLTISAARNI